MNINWPTHLGVLEVLHILLLPGVLAQVVDILCQGSQVSQVDHDDLQEEIIHYPIVFPKNDEQLNNIIKSNTVYNEILLQTNAGY